MLVVRLDGDKLAPSNNKHFTLVIRLGLKSEKSPSYDVIRAFKSLNDVFQVKHLSHDVTESLSIATQQYTLSTRIADGALL